MQFSFDYLVSVGFCRKNLKIHLFLQYQKYFTKIDALVYQNLKLRFTCCLDLFVFL